MHLQFSQIIQTFVDGLTLGMLYILIASGITLMFGIMHIVNFAHGAIVMLSAFTFFIFYELLGINFFLSLIITALCIGIFGIFIGRICFQPFRGELDRSFITSLGLILVFEASMLIIFGNFAYGVSSPFHGVVRFFGISISWERIVVMIVGLVAMIGLFLFIKFTKWGLAMVASTQEETAAMLQGIDINKVSAICMFIGSVLAGIAGALVGAMFSIEPYMGGAYVVKCFMIVGIGGLGSLPGAVVGGLMLGFLEAFGSLLTGAAIGPLIAFIIVILFLIFRPRGLLGHEL